jgi:hypothetical protein
LQRTSIGNGRITFYRPDLENTDSSMSANLEPDSKETIGRKLHYVTLSLLKTSTTHVRHTRHALPC